MSKEIQMMESQLGFALFLRKRNRIIELTEPGKRAIAQRVLTEIEDLRHLAEDFTSETAASSRSAHAHDGALCAAEDRRKFVRKYPELCLGLEQGNPEQIC